MWSRGPSAPGIRPPAVAGSWYPSDPAELRARIEEMCAEVPTAAARGALRGLVVPHAGLVYSGSTAARGWTQVRAADVDRVIVLAPNHRVMLRGTAVDPSIQYETPLGRIPVDSEAVAALSTHPGVVADARPFAAEHAVEMQLPFMQVLLPAARLIPVLVGEARGGESAAAALAPLLDDRTLLVVSSDFTHYGADYGYVPFTEQVPESIEALDREAIAALLERDAGRFQAHLRRSGATICGRRPLAVFLELLRPEWKGELLGYTTSGALTGDFERCVSYAAISYHAVGTGAGLTSLERSRLLFVARQTLESLFQPPALEVRLAEVQRTPSLERPSGVFVSLHRRRDGRLRGCIGSLLPGRPLLEGVVENARAAAGRDPRFAPLREGELEAVEIEISVLGPLVPVGSHEEIVVGRDGLVLSDGTQRGVLLPQVASDHGWTREEFLANLCLKAGLPAEAYRAGVTLERFEAEVFSEREALSP
jgi:AmmeMemoRadiSam system protein B/AmmeMemoRadiSam system protein A